MNDLKTFLVDGGMAGRGGGRSLAVRGLVDMYQHGADQGYQALAENNIPVGSKVLVWDACHDEETGFQLWEKHTATHQPGWRKNPGQVVVKFGRFGTEMGKIAYGDIAALALESAQRRPTRLIIDLPFVSAGETLEQMLMSGLLQDLNAIPIWLMGTGVADTATLADRVMALPEIYRDRGVVLRNSHCGPWEAFNIWQSSGTRRALVDRGGWLDLFMLHLSEWLDKKMHEECLNMPLDLANGKALKDGNWIGMWRLSIQLWRGAFMNRMNVIEKL